MINELKSSLELNKGFLNSFSKLKIIKKIYFNSFIENFI